MYIQSMKKKKKLIPFRLGLCCQFTDEPIKFRCTTVKYLLRLKKEGRNFLEYLSRIILDNLEALEKTIIFCRDNQIGCFRINSQFLPLFTYPSLKYEIDKLPQGAVIFERFAECKEKAAKQNIRLTFHPDQFVVLNSPREVVRKNSIEELEYHGFVAELLGADTINIHVGGVYGNKNESLERFKENFLLLSDRVKSRLTVENDDHHYTPTDLLFLNKYLKIPIVYDVHHHRCNKDELSIEEASLLCYNTWNREPIFHLSSPLEGWKGKFPYRHHDYINIHDFPLFWFQLSPLTIEIEAKAKELAITKLRQDLLSL